MSVPPMIPPMGIRMFFVITLLFSSNISARPVSYPGGSTLMAFNDYLKRSVYYHYSPTHRYSLGLELLEDKHKNENHSYLRLTYLLNRKNTLRSQRNFYFQTGISTQVIGNHFYGLHGDWETRRLYSGFGVKRVVSDALSFTDKFFQVGFAPYLGDYGDFHTWLMLKTRKNRELGEWHTLPVLKFLKGNTMLEFGYSDRAEWDIHLMYRF